MMHPENGGAPNNYHNGSGYKSTSGSYDNDALERAKKQVDDVKGIMGENVQRIIARGENLQDLDDRANNLTANANEFQRTSRTLKRKMWWQNLKMMLVLGLIVIVVIVIIIVAAVGVPSGGGSSGGSTVATLPTASPSKAVEVGMEVARNITKRSLTSALDASEEALKDHGT